MAISISNLWPYLSGFSLDFAQTFEGEPEMLYRDRVVDLELAERMEAAGAVLIEGPKACGKTQTALRIAKSSVMLDVDLEAKRALRVDPLLVLEGPTPRLIDEWPESPSI